MCRTVQSYNSLAKAKICSESLIGVNERKSLSFLGITPSQLPASIKKIEVMLQNKTYTGFGLRNPNGGTEFFSPDYIHVQTEKIKARIESLIEQRNMLTKEHNNLQEEISSYGCSVEQLETQLLDLKAHYNDVVKSIEGMVIKIRKGKASSIDKTNNRLSLKSDKFHTQRSIKATEITLSVLKEKLHRFDELNSYLPLLDLKIDDLQRHLSIPNTVTIGSPDVLFFPFHKGDKSKYCCLFISMFDYIAYVCGLSQPTAKQLPFGCDCYVMNDIRNFISLMLCSDDYDKIYVFFPNTILGDTLCKTLKQRNPDRVVCATHYYDKYFTLLDYVKSITNQNDFSRYE